MKLVSALTAVLMCAACAQTVTPPPEAPPEAPRVVETFEGEYCETPVFKVDADFSAAGMSSCAVIGPRKIEVFLVPENKPINASPWYAVRLTPHQAGDVEIVLRYDEHAHRYKPKVSPDGVAWTVVPDDRVDAKAAGFRVSIDLELGDAPLFLSAQEIFTNAAHDAWIAGHAEKDNISDHVIGASIEGRPIRMLRTEAKQDAPKTVMLVGRQHPPEVTGALAMVSFTDEMLSETALAKAFRAKFDLIVIPNLNPDGVEHGHWRHNMAGIDLNRDWGPFTQPETRAAQSVIEQIEDPGLALFLDFHSTRYNVFYTQEVGKDGTEYGFTAEWLSRAGDKLSDYDFSRQGAHNVDLPTSKTFIYEQFGIPAITYELGDETDREQIAQTARVFAQEMMTLLLEQE